MANRSDGPALNGALAATGALLGVFSLLVTAGLLISAERLERATGSAEAIPYALPFREPYVTARGVLERREMVLLRLRDEDGLVGLGEAVRSPCAAARNRRRSCGSWRRWIQAGRGPAVAECAQDDFSAGPGDLRWGRRGPRRPSARPDRLRALREL